MRTSSVMAGLLALGCASGAYASTPKAQPPAQWAGYIAAVRKAEAITGDEARCNAYPDLPGNEWRPGAAQGRCSILRKPAWSLDGIERQIATPEGLVELERDFAALLDAHYHDQSKRDQIFVAFDVFDTDARSGEIAQRWLKLAPDSPFANTAAGVHYGSSGWQARGTRLARDTQEEQFQRMSEQFAKAVPLYLRALELEPRLSVACYKLNGIGRQSSEALQQFASSRCSKIDPDSYFLALERVMSSEPRWGGSDEKLRLAVAYAAARTDRNPMLGALLGEAAAYRPMQEDDLGAVADDIAAAARMGPSATVSSRAGLGYRSRKDGWSALAYLSQAIRFRPDDASFRMWRAGVLHDLLGENEWARSDMQMAVQLEPDNSRYLYTLGMIMQELGEGVAARPYFKRAMNGDHRQQSMERHCLTFLLPTVETGPADACTRDLVAEFPQNGEAWRMRAWTLFSAHDPTVLEAVEQFIRYAENTRVHQATLEEIRTYWKPVLDRLRAARRTSATPAK